MIEKRNITITLEKAKEWYNSNDDSLKEIALQAFTEKELTSKSFKEITTFKKAVEALDLDWEEITKVCNNLKKISKASAAMFKVNLIRKALNLNYKVELTEDPKNSRIWYSYNPFISEDSTYYFNELKSGEVKVIGYIKNKDITYKVIGGDAFVGSYAGLGCFYSAFSVGYAYANTAFLGCVNKEIAKHFSKYFGMLITEAKFGDIEGFEIIE